MPTGHSITATSNGQMIATHRTSSSSGPRGMPGCTRYQCPRSMASVIDPRNAAPTTTRATDRASGSPAATPAATRPISPMIGATRSRRGGNSAASLVDGVALAVDPGHGGDPCAARLDAVALAGHARRLALDRHDRARGPVASATPALAMSRTITSSP